MDEITVGRWLDEYLLAWRANERDAIVRLFTADCAYRYHPEDDPVVGAAAIADDWLEKPDDPPSWTAHYRPWLVADARAVATGVTHYVHPDGSPRATYYNVFLMAFAADGRCREFTEVFREDLDPTAAAGRPLAAPFQPEP